MRMRGRTPWGGSGSLQRSYDRAIGLFGRPERRNVLPQRPSAKTAPSNAPVAKSPPRRRCRSTTASRSAASRRRERPSSASTRARRATVGRPKRAGRRPVQHVFVRNLGFDPRATLGSRGAAVSQRQPNRCKWTQSRCLGTVQLAREVAVEFVECFRDRAPGLGVSWSETGVGEGTRAARAAPEREPLLRDPRRRPGRHLRARRGREHARVVRVAGVWPGLVESARVWSL